MKEELQVTRQLVPLIIFIVLIILVTLIIYGSRLPEKPSERRKAEDTISLVRQNINTNIPDVDQSLAMASVLNDRQQYGEAEDRLRTALVFHPKNRQLLLLLGSTLYQQKKYLEAEGIYRQMLLLNPNDPTAFNNLGVALASQKKYNEAIVQIKKVYEQNRKSPVAILNLAGMYSLAGNKTEALKYFQIAYDEIGIRILPLSYNPNFDTIRDEKAFQDILSDAMRKRKAKGK